MRTEHGDHYTDLDDQQLSQQELQLLKDNNYINSLIQHVAAIKVLLEREKSRTHNKGCDCRACRNRVKSLEDKLKAAEAKLLAAEEKLYKKRAKGTGHGDKSHGNVRVY